MRSVGKLDSESAVRTFSDFLYVQGISNQIEPDRAGSWEIWIHSDDDLPRARHWLEVYRGNPNDPNFRMAARAAEVREQEILRQKKFEERFHTRDQVFRKLIVGIGPLSAFFMAVSIVVFLVSKFGTEFAPVHFLFFSEFFPLSGFAERIMGSPEIRSGQIWRLFTPIFIHGNGLHMDVGFMHILFNMLWLRDLGTMIEVRESWKRLLVLVLAIAAGSNLAQYVFSGPSFGGMSGVVYGLLGYVWMKGKYDPQSGLFLHKSTVTMMLIWLVVCYTGALGTIANYAHTAGLVIGVTWGVLSGQLFARR